MTMSAREKSLFHKIRENSEHLFFAYFVPDIMNAIIILRRDFYLNKPNGAFLYRFSEVLRKKGVNSVRRIFAFETTRNGIIDPP